MTAAFRRQAQGTWRTSTARLRTMTPEVNGIVVRTKFS